MFEEEAGGFSQITRIRPNGPDRIETFDKADGTLAVLHRLKNSLNLDVQTVNKQTLASAERKLENNWLKFYADNVMPLEKGAVFGRRD